MTRALARHTFRPEVLGRMRPYSPLDFLRALFAPAVQEQPQFLTVKEASEYIGLSQTFLRRVIRAGHLPHLVDRCTKVRRSDLDNLAIDGGIVATTKKLAAVTSEMRQVVTARRGR